MEPLSENGLCLSELDLHGNSHLHESVAASVGSAISSLMAPLHHEPQHTPLHHAPPLHHEPLEKLKREYIDLLGFTAYETPFQSEGRGFLSRCCPNPNGFFNIKKLCAHQRNALTLQEDMARKPKCPRIYHGSKAWDIRQNAVGIRGVLLSNPLRGGPCPVVEHVIGFSLLTYVLAPLADT